MGLEIVNTKGISQNTLVEDILNEIRANPKFFIHLARIFANYKTNDSHLLEEIQEQIIKRLESPKLNLSVEKKKYLYDKLIQIYKKDKKTFNKIRSEILENTIYYFGPFTQGIQYKQCYIEPVIKDVLNNGQEKIIGDSDIKCDFVFFYDEFTPLEFIECKADIANIIPRTLPFSKVRNDHRKKILYLHKAYEYLHEHYKAPFIYFACYNLEYSDMLNNLQNNWGFQHMNFINADEIIKFSNRII